MSRVLKVENVSYAWSFRGGKAEALLSVSAEFRSGVPHVICGASGSGKTTLALLLSGLITDNLGKIRLDQQAIADCRKQIAYIFQFPESIFFEDSVEAELRQITGDDSTGTAEEYFQQLGIRFEDIAQKHPFHLSEGYSRLVATVLQMSRDPLVLIADEPTIGLDWEHHAQMTKLLKGWITPERILLIISHDLDLMQELGGYSWVLAKGELAWSGETHALLADPALLEQYSLSF